MDKEFVQSVLAAYKFNLSYAEQLCQDIPDNLIAYSPSKGLENHPAFTIGHLVMASARLAVKFGQRRDEPEHYAHLFDRKGPGDPTMPVARRPFYPTLDELLSELKRQHQKVENAALSVDEKEFQRRVKWRFSKYFPTLGDMFQFMCISHESMHLSQIAAWRRAMRMNSALKAL